MNTTLVTNTGKNPQVDSSFAVLEQFLSQGMRLQLTKSVTSPAGGGNISFQVAHTLGVVPHFVFAMPRTAGDAIGCSVAERNSWTTRFVVIHASGASKTFDLLIGTLD